MIVIKQHQHNCTMYMQRLGEHENSLIVFNGGGAVEDEVTLFEGAGCCKEPLLPLAGGEVP